MDGKGMQFKHTYMTKDKMKKAGEGAFSSQYKSYIADGESALKDKIHGGVSRDDVMQDVRRSLRQEMRSANDRSNMEAMRMQAEHRQLRDRMQEALMMAKEATRQRKLLDARMLAEKSKQSRNAAADSELELSNMYAQREEDLLENADNLQGDDYDQRFADAEYIKSLRDQAGENVERQHHKNLFSLFRAIGKKMARDDIQEDMDKQDAIIAEQKEVLRAKTKEWNDKRKKYADESFRKYYNDFDSAAGRYRMLNRKGTDAMAPVKDVKEYVGIFDIDKLEDTLARLQDNPYLDAQVQLRNKKDNRSNAEEDFIKAHKKITMMSEAEEGGVRIRYKLNSDFSGYEATRQYNRENELTAINEYNEANKKEVYDADRLKLEVDEKDAEGKYINSEDNVEIIQAKQRKWFGAKTVNGVFLNGEFISADRRIVKNSKDSAAIGKNGYAWKTLAEKERIRRAVLKASIFRQINSKTIQHAMGYGAGGAANASKVKDSMIESIAKAILSEKGLAEWSDRDKADLDQFETGAIGEFFDQVDDVQVNKKEAKKKQKESQKNEKEAAAIQLKEQQQIVKDKLFNADYEKDLLKAETYDDDYEDKDEDHVLPNKLMDKWEKILTGDDEEAKNALPSGVKVKVAYDVIRQEYAVNKQLMIPGQNQRTNQVLNALKDDHKALSDVALLLLSEDTKPEYWRFAKFICSRLIMTGFEKKFEGTFDSRFNRALAKGRSENGQMMRIALIDELNANRTHTDPDNFLNSLMPTRWKQYSEDVQGKRGIGAIFHQKFTDGSLLSFANDIFGSVVDSFDAYKTFDKETIKNMEIATMYTSALTSAINIGAITETTGYAISDIYELSKGEERDRDKALSRRGFISLVFNMLNNIQKIVKTVRKFIKDKKKAAEKRAKKDPSYDPKEDLEYLDNEYYKMISSFVNISVGAGTAVCKFVGPAAKQAKSIFGMVKAMIGVYEDACAIHQANKQIDRIKMTEGDLTALEKKEYKTREDNELLDVLKENSQLQYGLACAKRKNRDEKAVRIVSVISNSGKTVINFIKAFIPGGKDNVILKGVDAVWGAVMTGAKMVTEMVRHKLGVKANIEKMLGKEFRGATKGVLDDVLRREVGIESSDYLTDLARIFMSIDTHVFMQEAKTDGEKKIGAKIMQTLFNNKEYNENTLNKAKVDKLMTSMGVKGNFRCILKHSLAANPA